MRGESGRLPAWGELALATLALIAMNASHLTDPPFWDVLVGLGHQGSWLAAHDLDALGLWSQPGYVEQGPCRDPFSGFAALYGLLVWLLGPRSSFVALHLMSCLWGGVAFVLARRGFQRAGASWPWLWSACGVLHPIFSGQVAAIYVEVALAACTLLVLELVSQRRYALAAGVCLGAFSLRASAVLLALALLVWVVWRLVMASWVYREPWRSALAERRWALAVPFAALVAPGAWVSSGGELAYTPRLGLWLELHVAFCPVLGALVLGSLPLAAVVLGVPALRRRALGDREGFWETSLLGVLVWGYWASVLIHPLALPRYHTASILPLLLLWARLLKLVAGPRVSRALALGLLAFFLANQWGALLPAPPSGQRRSGEFLERSREWLWEVEADQRLCAELVRRQGEDAIIADWPHIHMLSFPQLGYVDAPPPRLYSFLPLSWGPSRPVTAEVAYDRRSLVVYAPTIFESAHPVSLRPDASSPVELMVRSRHGAAVVYRGFPESRLAPRGESE